MFYLTDILQLIIDGLNYGSFA